MKHTSSFHGPLRAIGFAVLASLVLIGGNVLIEGTVDSAHAGDDVDPCVTFAKTWDAAVEEAKLLNVPIVVHSHGFS